MNEEETKEVKEALLHLRIARAELKKTSHNTLYNFAGPAEYERYKAGETQLDYIITCLEGYLEGGAE